MKEKNLFKGSGEAFRLLFLILVLFSIVIFSIFFYFRSIPIAPGLVKFESCDAIASAFKESQSRGYGYGVLETLGGLKTMAPVTAPMAGAAADFEYSQTNVQVEGVDEADIVKTDGNYIYTLSGGKLIIAKAYPAEEAEILSETDLGNFTPQEIFIDNDILLIFGNTYQESDIRPLVGMAAKVELGYYPYYSSTTTVELWDIGDRSNPQLARSIDFEGNYITSRKIESNVYFVINTYPDYRVLENATEETAGEVVPKYRDRIGFEVESDEKDFVKTCRCADVEYFKPINPQSFITVASVSMSDVNAPINKEIIVGSGQDVYASLQNFYIAEANYPYYGFWEGGGLAEEKTLVHKFSLNDGQIKHLGQMEATGHILNQFSMDEYNNYFRIATTRGQVSRSGGGTTNNVYIFDSSLSLVGSLEDLAPGETIYSARFIGDRGYLVTFKKIDPFFVIDLSDPTSPRVLGKLKIPGYSDYLHPYDENHIIGIGKEAVEAEEGGNFAWYQGVKMALFDVTDVSNPIELHKVVIGDRGTDSDALHDHKAFLFDRDKNLLVVPILLAEIKGDKSTLPSNTYGDFVFQGAYVYTLTLDGGFDLKGRVTHYESNESFDKSGYYFYGDYSVMRSLYIDNILYTLSQKKIKLNSLTDLAEIKELKFGS